MHLFVGTLENYKLDSKGRLSIPTKWRERLGKDFYMVAVTVQGCKCLTLYPVEVFENMYMQMQRGTANQQYIMAKDFFSKAEEGNLDAQGRFTVNQRLKELSYLTNESSVVFQGSGKTIEIWNSSEFEKMQETINSDKGILDLMDEYNVNGEQ